MLCSKCGFLFCVGDLATDVQDRQRSSRPSSTPPRLTTFALVSQSNMEPCVKLTRRRDLSSSISLIRVACGRARSRHPRGSPDIDRKSTLLFGAHGYPEVSRSRRSGSWFSTAPVLRMTSVPAKRHWASLWAWRACLCSELLEHRMSVFWELTTVTSPRPTPQVSATVGENAQASDCIQVSAWLRLLGSATSEVVPVLSPWDGPVKWSRNSTTFLERSKTNTPCAPTNAPNAQPRLACFVTRYCPYVSAKL